MVTPPATGLDRAGLDLLEPVAMVRLGHVHDDLMIDVRAVNEKLRDALRD